jgi:transmembrane sensor
MTDVNHADALTELEYEALDHVQRLMSGAATVEALEAAKRWENLSPAHAEAISSARRLWTQLGPVGHEILAREKHLAVNQSRGAAWHRPSRRALLGGGVAAATVAAAGYAVARPPFDLWPSLAALAADYRTATGEQRQVTLADGLSAALNTETSITLRDGSNGHNRVELISGETVISVADNSEFDHIVSVGDGRISFRDASLNVRYDGRAACTITCLQGAARVERRGAVVELRPDQYVAYVDRGLSASKPADPDVATAWRRGLLIFHQAPLSDVIAEINRYRRGKIVLLNAALGRRIVNARFTIDDIDDIMVLARRELGATVTSLPGGVVVLT